MTIRLTSVETFDKVLAKLKHRPEYHECVNEPFIKYCVPTIREGLQYDNDEWYLDVDWLSDRDSYKIVMVLRYHKRSDMLTDIEYLAEEELEK
ncbi:MAG: hypothetical protein HDS67_00075 [Bacteroidales bacterium]|nr:hypothetical protein [Bacteroidales bacterium]